MPKNLRKISLIVLSLMFILCCFGLSACGNTADNTNNQLPTKFNLSSTEFIIEVNKTAQISVEYIGEETVLFKTEDVSIATVDSVGKITALKEGITYISVTAGDNKQYCKVNVVDVDTSVVLNSYKVNMINGSSHTMNAKVIVDGVESNNIVEWDVDDEDTSKFELIKVGNEATFISKAEGEFVVTAKSGEFSANCIIRVISDDSSRLLMPEVTVQECTKLSWKEVVGANAYGIKINGISDWLETEELSMDITTYLVGENAVKNDETKEVYIVSMAKDNYNAIDSYVQTVLISHSYIKDELSEATCDTAGVVNFICSDCEYEYTDNYYFEEHDYHDSTLVCNVCGKEKTNNVLYGFDGNFIPMPTEIDADNPESEWSIKYYDYYKQALVDKWNNLVAEKTYDAVDEITDVELNLARNKLDRAHQALWTAVETNKDNIPYEDREKCYYVVTYTGNDQDAVYIKSEYNDGTNGNHPVKYVGTKAFSNNTNLKKVVLPQSVTELRGECFYSSQIETVVAPGVTFLPLIVWGSNYMPYNFENCFNLKSVVFGDGVTLYGRNFHVRNPREGYDSSCTIYVVGNGSNEVVYKDGAATRANNLIANGKVEYQYQPDNLDEYICGLWYFDEEMNVVLKNHEYEFNTCLHCGAINTFGVKYRYDVNTDSYIVSDASGCKKAVVDILSSYNDNLHGEKPVTKIGYGAFRDNVHVKQVNLPSSVVKLDAYAFSGCLNLEILDMRGVTHLERMEAAEALNNCGKLQKVVVNPKLKLEAVQSFSKIVGDDGLPADLYVLGTSDDDELSILYTSADMSSSLSNNRNFGGGNRYYYYEGGKCGFWSFEKGVPVNRPHGEINSSGICLLCDANTDNFGIKYIYDATVGGYTVAGVYDTSLTVIRPLESFNDGINGRKDVVKVEYRAFNQNNVITEVFLPDTVTTLGVQSFRLCSNLTYLQACGVTGTLNEIVYGCDNLTHIVVSNGVTFGSSWIKNSTTSVAKLDIYVKITNIKDIDITINSKSFGTDTLFTKKLFILGDQQDSGTFRFDAQTGKAVANDPESYYLYTSSSDINLPS